MLKGKTTFLLIALVVVPMATSLGQILMKHKSIHRISPNTLSSADLYNRLRQQTHEVTHCVSTGTRFNLRFRCSPSFYAQLKERLKEPDVMMGQGTFGDNIGTPIDVDPTFPLYRKRSKSERRQRRKVDAAILRRVGITFATGYKVTYKPSYGNLYP